MAYDYRTPDLPSFMTMTEFDVLIRYIKQLSEGEDDQIGILVRDKGRDRAPASWIEFSIEGKEYAIWRHNFDLYEVDDKGAVGDDPIIKTEESRES